MGRTPNRSRVTSLNSTVINFVIKKIVLGRAPRTALPRPRQTKKAKKYRSVRSWNVYVGSITRQELLFKIGSKCVVMTERLFLDSSKLIAHTRTSMNVNRVFSKSFSVYVYTFAVS